MKRFFWGLVFGGLSGGGTYWLSHDAAFAAFAAFIGLLVALLIWFTTIGDIIVDLAVDFGSAIIKAIGAIVP